MCWSAYVGESADALPGGEDLGSPGPDVLAAQLPTAGDPGGCRRILY
jgi:hypothetical protein